MTPYHPDRDPLTLRYARTLSETARDPNAWWEPNIPKPKPRPFRWGPPMMGAPSGPMAELQRVLLRGERRSIVSQALDAARAGGRWLRGWLRRPGSRDGRIDRACWLVSIVALAFLAWAVLRAPAP